MTDADAEFVPLATLQAEAALDRLRTAAARVRQHDAERRELAAAIADARRAGMRPKEIAEVVPYDRNHVGRILSEHRLTVPRKSRDSAD